MYVFKKKKKVCLKKYWGGGDFFPQKYNQKNKILSIYFKNSAGIK